MQATKTYFQVRGSLLHLRSRQNTVLSRDIKYTFRQRFSLSTYYIECNLSASLRQVWESDFGCICCKVTDWKLKSERTETIRFDSAVLCVMCIECVCAMIRHSRKYNAHIRNEKSIHISVSVFDDCEQLSIKCSECTLAKFKLSFFR